MKTVSIQPPYALLDLGDDQIICCELSHITDLHYREPSMVASWDMMFGGRFINVKMAEAEYTTLKAAVTEESKEESYQSHLDGIYQNKPSGCLPMLLVGFSIAGALYWIC